jgi:hypothetical protein
LIPLISGEIQYALSNSYHPGIKQKIHHLLSSFQDGRFDLQKYIEQEKYNNSDDIEYDGNDLIGIHQKYADIAIHCVKQCEKVICETKNNKISDEGAITSLLTLNRLTASFQSVLILTRFGFYIETQILFRFILEQLAYAYTCMNLVDKKEIDVIEPNKCIRDLKGKYEFVGKFYGLLSNKVHFKDSDFGEIISENQDYGGINVNIRSGKKSKINFLVLFYLAFLYLDISRIIDKKYSGKENQQLNFMLSLISKIFHVFQIELKNEEGLIS